MAFYRRHHTLREIYYQARLPLGWGLAVVLFIVGGDRSGKINSGT